MDLIELRINADLETPYMVVVSIRCSVPSIQAATMRSHSTESTTSELIHDVVFFPQLLTVATNNKVIPGLARTE
jgi:hypothetical protein